MNNFTSKPEDTLKMPKGQIGRIIKGQQIECIKCAFTCKQFKDLLAHWNKVHKDA